MGGGAGRITVKASLGKKKKKKKVRPYLKKTRCADVDGSCL
jgi:hypothetical protein